MPVGAHLNVKKGLAGAVAEARGIGADALQVFTSSPQMWRAKPVDESAAAAFRTARAEGPLAVVVHDSYLINLCAAGEELREKSRAALADELNRCAQYGVELVNSHMGSHVGQGEAEGIRLVANAVRPLLRDSDPSITLLMETTAGAGSALGGTFEALAQALHELEGDARVGVCLDTCHVFAAGYDLRTQEDVLETLGKFDEVIGLDRLKAIHLNDSKGAFGSHKDRHANLGEGEIGLEGLKAFVTDPRLAHVPMILETPHEGDGHIRDLNWLREVRG